VRRNAFLTPLVTVAIACAPALAQMQVIFQDDFETDPFGSPASWPTASGCTPLTWDAGKNIVPMGSGHSLYADLSQDQVYRDLNVSPEPSGVRATWWVYDGSMTRAYGQLLAYTGGGFGSGTNEQLYAAGKYNNVTMPGEVWSSTKYQGRVLYPSATVGWFNLNAPGSPNRSAGWHQFDVEVTSDGMARFYVDEFLSRTIAGATVKTLDSVTLGFGTSSSSNGDAWFDGVVAARIDNVLSLNMSTPLYRRPGQSVVVKMDVSNLLQMVNGCQALIGYSSTFFPVAGTVVPGGGGVWEEMIYQVWDSLAGELDTAIGVELGTSPGGGTDANGTVAIITLTAGTTEGLTKLDFRPDGLGGYATMLSDLNAQPVWPYKRGSQTVCIDGTLPNDFTVTPGTTCTKDNVTLTFSTSDPGVYASGIDYYELFVDSASVGRVTSPYVFNLGTYTDGPHAIVVRAYDRAGNSKDTPAIAVALDTAAPTISSVTATQNGNDVLCPNVAVQGVVDIYVTLAAGGGCAAVQVPTVEVAGITPTTYVDQAGDTYHYQVTVVASTANGAHTLTVTAVDVLGNSVVDSGNEVCVNKSQITGTVEMDTLRDTTYAFDRVVVFKATNAAGTVLKAWPTVSVHFVNNPAARTASGTYTLTAVPASTARLSAKTAWSLRRRQALSFDGNDQSTLDFTKSAEKDLLGGDLDDSNTAIILDYSILRTYWNSYSATADINGDGQVQLLDYSILKDNWFNVGDPP
jgi:hypothetical protein